MALTKCTECGHEVSTNAGKCPQCGGPIRKETSPLVWILLLITIVGFIAYGVAIGQHDARQKERQLAAALHSIDSRLNTRYAHGTINIREGAGKQYKVVGQLRKGDSVEVENRLDKWAEIAIGGVVRGYVYEPLLKAYPVPSIEISDFNWRTDPDFGTDGAVIWNVEVQNNTDHYIDSVRVEFSTYDSSDKLMTSTFAYVHGLSPGGTGTTESYATYFGTEENGKVRIVP